MKYKPATRKKLYILFLLFQCILTRVGVLHAQVKQKNKKQRPNIIFILTDDQRWSALGYAGNDLVHTPQMDRLARQGTYFSNAMVTTPICAASRATIFTGLYERTHRYNFQTGDIRAEYMAASYPAILKNNGYQTAFFGKYGVRYSHLDKQFDVYDSYDRNNAYHDRRGYFYKTIGKDTVHLTRYTGHQALDYIDNVDRSRPFALSLSFSAPHAHDKAPRQYFWQKASDPLLQDTTIPGPELAGDKYFNRLPKKVKEGFNRLRWHWRYDTPQKYQHSVKGYYRMISGVDREIGKIRKELKKRGMADNTVIIFMGDNGYFQGERQLAGKWLMYDNSVRVPMVIYDPRIKNQKDSEQMALNVDIPSTILDLAGIKQPKSWQGKSLMPIASGHEHSLRRDTVLIEHLWEFEHIPPSEGVRTKDWKYFRYVDNKSIEELYNLDKDPRETNNLADNPRYANVLTSLRQKLDQLSKQKSDHYSEGPNNLTVETLRNPEKVAIEDHIPEYGWVVPEGAVYQSAYQLLVASSRKNIDNNIGDVWDSGRVRRSKSTGIEHGGKKLNDGETYFWKVRIWDHANRLTDYSKSQSFTIADRKTSAISTPNSFQIDRIDPQMFEKRGDVYFMDFGKDAFATLRFRYDAKRNQTLIFRIGEQLKGDAINREPEGNIRYQEIEVHVNPEKKEYQLHIKPDKRNTKPGAVALPDSFPVLMPFRYAEMEGAKQPLSAKDFTQLAYHSYWNDSTSSFESSNNVLDQVWNLCKYSMKATSFAGLYVDGDRERIPYEADAYLNQLSRYNTDRGYAMARQTIEYFMKHPTWPTEWQLHVAMMFYADYMYTGNTELIKKYYEQLKYKTLMELSRRDGLISSANATPEFMKKLGFEDPKAELRDITDWPPAQKDTGWDLATKEGERDGFVFKPYNTVINSFYYKNMKIMAEFARVLGKTKEAMDFELRAIKVKKAINEKLFNEETGAYVDGEGTEHSSIHANMMPLAFGIVPKDRQQSVVDFIKSRGMACSVYGAQYLMEALYNAGADAYALKLLSSKSDRSWYNMIRVGSTITMEAWDMKYKPNSDWNHAWGAVPANIIPRELWGIRPKEPGYKIAIIKPQMGGLKNSTIEVPTIKGEIRGTYKYINDRMETYHIEIPANMLAEFEVNVGPGKIVKLDGKKVPTSFGNVRLTPGNHQIQLVVNSF